MATITPEPLPTEPTDWDAFSSRHPGNPFLECDPLYSLSEPLIDAILEEVPGFFTPAQECFERDLARTASTGFFLHRRLGRMDPCVSESEQKLNERAAMSSQQLEELMAEELRRAGADPEEIQTYFEGRAEYRTRINDRQDAYVGWLIMNSEYHAEVRQFREQWENAVRAMGRFPRLPLWLIPDPANEAESPTRFREECDRFFCRWSLETLATWDLPVPMEPDLDTRDLRDAKLLSLGGVFLFVPWHLLRGDKVDLRQMVQRSRLASPPDHLLGWVNKWHDRGGDQLGDMRYATIGCLYRYNELVLVRRYADACVGNRQRLDLALATVLARGEDTVKKLRLELGQVLEEIASCGSS